MAGLLSSLSRGAWLGAMGGVLVILLLRARFTLFARVIGIGIPVVVACWFMLPAQAQDYASDFSVTANNIRARFDSLNLAYGYFQSNPLLGVGVGLRKEYDATNLVMSTLAETGVTGLLAFTSIYVCFAFAIWRSRSRLGVNDRSFSLLAIGSALAMCQLLHGMVDHFWSRGCLPAWAGMGFVVWASQNTTIPARRGRA
jgi:O-antigen ligase